jgi:hypothetical protein
MLAGLQAMPDDAQLPIRRGVVPKAVRISQLAAVLDLFAAVDAQLIVLKIARAQLLNAVGDLPEMLAELQASLSLLHGRRSPELASFGIKPYADRRSLSPDQRVVRAEKVRQTRRLRHTKGSRQKAAIKFTGKIDVNTELKPTNAPSAPIRAGLETPATSPLLLTNGHGPAG